MISGWCNEEAACAGETLEQREGIMKAVICSAQRPGGHVQHRPPPEPMRDGVWGLERPRGEPEGLGAMSRTECDRGKMLVSDVAMK